MGRKRSTRGAMKERKLKAAKGNGEKELGRGSGIVVVGRLRNSIWWKGIGGKDREATGMDASLTNSSTLD